MNRFKITNFQYIDSDSDKSKIYAEVHIERNPAGHKIMMDDIHEPLTFDAHPSETVKIRVYSRHRLRQNNFKGTTLGRSVVNMCDIEGLLILQLYKYTEEGGIQELPRSIQFKIQDITSPTASVLTLNNELAPSVNETTKLKKVIPFTDFDAPTISDAVDDAKAAFENITPAPWQPLLKKVERFNELMSIIVEVHPYAKLAWSVLSAASKFTVDQSNRDENIQRLISLLDDVFEFLDQASQLETITRLTDDKGTQSLGSAQLRPQIQILVKISQQAIECGYFICDYAKDVSFWKRTIKHSISQVDDKIEDFESKFSRLKSCFQDHAVLQTELSVLQIKFTTSSTNIELEKIATNAAVNEMIHATGARYDPDKGCLPDTRVTIIDEIMEWASQPSDVTPGAKIFWLSGVAGSGKSAIAHTVAQKFQNMGRLGSSFCFSVSSQAVCGSQHLFSTISWELANFDSAWKLELSKVLKADPSITSSHSVSEQFEILLLRPAQALHMTGPIVIVIDALDESGDIASRKAILAVLAGRATDLPSNFYFVITSRPESDILSVRATPRAPDQMETD